MKTTFLVIAVLLMASACPAQVRFGSAPPAPPAGATSVTVPSVEICDDSFGPDLTVGPVLNATVDSAPDAAPSSTPAPQIIVVSGAGNPDNVGGRPQAEVQPGELAAAARLARQQNANAPKAEVLIDQDNDGKIRLAYQE
jgi:hypothetical protein